MGARFPEVDEAELHALVDGRLPESRQAALLAWVEDHPHERERIDAYVRQRDLLAELGTHLSRLGASSPQAELQRKVLMALRRQARMRRALRAVTAAAAGVALVVGGYWSLGRFDRPPVAVPGLQVQLDVPEFPFGGSLVAPVSASAVTSLEGEMSTHWIADHLPGAAFQLPDLSALGLRFVGGTVLPEATASVRLVYVDDASHHLLLYAGVVSSTARQALALVPEGQLSLQWRQGPLVFALVGGRDSMRLLDAMRLVNAGLTPKGPIGEPPARSIEVPVVATAPVEPAIQSIGLPSAEPVAGPKLPGARLPGAAGVVIETEPLAPGVDSLVPTALPTKDEPPKPL